MQYSLTMQLETYCLQIAREEAAEQAEAEARSTAREAEIEARSSAFTLRVEPLGSDRHHRRYTCLRHSPGLIWVEDVDGKHIGVLHTPEQVEMLMAGLLDRGPREKELARALIVQKAPLVSALQSGSGAELQGVLLDDDRACSCGSAAVDTAEPMEVDGAVAALPSIVAKACAGARVMAGAIADVGPPPASEGAAVAAMLRHGSAYVRKLLQTLIDLGTGTENCSDLLPIIDAAHDLSSFIAVRPALKYFVAAALPCQDFSI
jgi:hypothetical protein